MLFFLLTAALLLAGHLFRPTSVATMLVVQVRSGRTFEGRPTNWIDNDIAAQQREGL